MSYEVDSPPFEPGMTFGNGRTIVSTDTGCQNWEGRVYDFPDLDYSQQGAKPNRSNRRVKRMVVRNMSPAAGATSGAILPKRLCTFITSSGPDFLGQVDGYACTDNAYAFPADEFLPAAGVARYDWFYIVVQGPAKVKLPLVNTGFNGDIAVGGLLAALTAVTSGSTTAGRIANVNITGSSQATDYTFAVNAVANLVGRALSASTTSTTNGDLLVNVLGKW